MESKERCKATYHSDLYNVTFQCTQDEGHDENHTGIIVVGWGEMPSINSDIKSKEERFVCLPKEHLDKCRIPDCKCKCHTDKRNGSASL